MTVLLWNKFLTRIRTITTVPLSRKLTNVCEWLVSLTISQASAKRGCERAHTSDALPTRELKLASAKLKNTRWYLQMNERVLAIVLANTCNQTCQYSRVLAIELMSTRNHSRVLWVCHTIVLSSAVRAGWRFEESWYQETRCHASPQGIRGVRDCNM